MSPLTTPPGLICARDQHRTDQPSSRHVSPGQKLVPFENPGVRVLHGSPQPRQGGVYIQTGGACAQSLHRFSGEGENVLFMLKSVQPPRP